MSSDAELLSYALQLRRPWLDDVMLLSSELGAGGFIWWIAALITMVFPSKRAAAWRMLLAGLVTWTISEFALKPAVDRPRPFERDPSIAVIGPRPQTPSFPSGHAAMAAAYALGGARMLPGSAWLWWPFAAVVAVSRVYLGVHWPSDIAAGCLLGLATAWFVLGGSPPRPGPWRR